MRLLILTQKVDKNDPILGFFHRWIEEFAWTCESVIVICLYEGRHDLPENVRVLSLGKEHGASRLTYLTRLYRYACRERKNYDSVFVHMNQIYVLLCGLLWRMMGKQIGLWYAHGRAGISLRIATSFVHHIFTSTHHGFMIDTRKRHILGQGIDGTLFEHVSEDDTGKSELVSWGRISPAKDYMTMLRAMKRLRDSGTDISFDIIGGVGTPDQQRYLDELVKYVKDNDLAGKVAFLGPIVHEELSTHISKHGIFVHASMNRSLDKAALEAMVAGLLILTCNESVIGILPERTHELLVFPAGDDGVLAKKISTLMVLSRNERLELTQTLRDIVLTEHSLGSLVSKILAWYNRPRLGRIRLHDLQR